MLQKCIYIYILYIVRTTKTDTEYELLKGQKKNLNETLQAFKAINKLNDC